MSSPKKENKKMLLHFCLQDIYPILHIAGWKEQCSMSYRKITMCSCMQILRFFLLLLPKMQIKSCLYWQMRCFPYFRVDDRNNTNIFCFYFYAISEFLAVLNLFLMVWFTDLCSRESLSDLLYPAVQPPVR